MVFLLGLQAPLAAQGLGADYAAYGAPLSSFGASGFLNASILNQSQHKGGRGGRPSSQNAPHLSAPGEGVAPDTLRALSARFPPERRARAEKAFKEAFAGYTRLEARLGLPRQDLGGAVAAFIAGNYMAFHGRSVPDEHFRTLARQMRAALVSNNELARASVRERRQLYEQMATVGTFMALAQLEFQQKPDAQAQALFRDSARAQLEQFLKRPAADFKITATGLSLS